MRNPFKPQPPRLVTGGPVAMTHPLTGELINFSVREIVADRGRLVVVIQDRDSLARDLTATGAV